MKRRWGYDSKADPRYREEPLNEEPAPVIDDQKTETPKAVDIQQLRPGINPRGFTRKRRFNGGVSRRNAPSGGRQDNYNGYQGYGSQSGEQMAKEKTKLKNYGRNPFLDYRYQRGRRNDFDYDYYD